MIKPEHAYFIQNELNKARYYLNQESVLAFARQYLCDHFTLPPSSMHLEIAALLKDATLHRRKRIALAAPRLYKQTELVDVAYILWSICYDKESFILLVGDTQKQASEQLAIIKDSLESNVQILQDFPNAAGKNTKSWQANYFTSKTGIKVVATGLNQELHVYTFKGKKPSLIIFDILQEELLYLVSRAQSDMAYFKNILRHSCGIETNVIVIGTNLHYKWILESLLTTKDSNWICKKYQAIISEANNKELWTKWRSIFDCELDYQGDGGPQLAEVFFNDNKEAMLEGVQVLWPEYETYDKLMDIKASMMNDKLFNCEKQNMPTNIDLAKRERMRAQYFALHQEIAEEGKRKAAQTRRHQIK